MQAFVAFGPLVAATPLVAQAPVSAVPRWQPGARGDLRFGQERADGSFNCPDRFHSTSFFVEAAHPAPLPQASDMTDANRAWIGRARPRLRRSVRWMTRAALLPMLARGPAWLAARVRPDGMVDQTGNSRTGFGQERGPQGNLRTMSYGSAYRSSHGRAMIAGDPRWAALADRLHDGQQVENAERTAGVRRGLSCSGVSDPISSPARECRVKQPPAGAPHKVLLCGVPRFRSGRWPDRPDTGTARRSRVVEGENSERLPVFPLRPAARATSPRGGVTRVAQARTGQVPGAHSTASARVEDAGARSTV